MLILIVNAAYWISLGLLAFLPVFVLIFGCLRRKKWRSEYGRRWKTRFAAWIFRAAAVEAVCGVVAFVCAMQVDVWHGETINGLKGDIEVTANRAESAEQERDAIKRDLAAIKSDRTLTDDEKASMRPYLELIPGKITLFAVTGEREIQQYWKQWFDFLGDCGWTVSGVIENPYGTKRFPQGIEIKFKDLANVPPHAVALVNALNKASIKFGARTNQEIDPTELHMIIGPKVLTDDYYDKQGSRINIGTIKRLPTNEKD